MVNEFAFEGLQNVLIEDRIKNATSKYRSILSTSVSSEDVKRKKWIFTFKERKRKVKFVVEEQMYIMECLTDNLDLERIAGELCKDYILEIYDTDNNVLFSERRP